MTEWKTYLLGDICKTNVSSYSNKDGWEFVNYLDTGNITGNDIGEIQYINLLEEKLPSRAKRKVGFNSIIYSTVRPNQLHYGIIKEQPDNFLVSTGFTVIDVDENIADADFVYYWLTQSILTDQLHSIAEQSTSAYPSIKASDLEKLEIQLPSLEIQRKISSILVALDKKRKNNDALNRNLQEQLKTVFSSWFYDMTPFGGKEPEGTQYTPLEELCAVVTKGTTPTTLGMPFTDNGINFIKGETILENHSFDRTKLSFVGEETHEKLKRSQIESGDIVFTIAGTLGRFALVDDSIIPANTNQAVAILRASKVSSEYLYSFFLGNWHNEFYTKRIQQAVQANLSLGTIRSLPIMVLQEDLYEQYLDIITPLIIETKRIEQENLKLSEMRDTLLPKLMSGELDISDLDF